MNDTSKHAIVERINASKKDQGLSANEWSKKNDVSNATVSNALTGKWEVISDKMWNKLGAAVQYRVVEWMPAETRDYRAVQDWLKVAQSDGITIGLAHDPGSGKTFAMQNYANTRPEVSYLQCADFWSKRFFLQELYRSLGHNPGEMTTVELASGIISALRSKSHPLVILDEVDKLNDRTLMFFIELYNKLDGVCGFMLAGAPYLRLAVEKGAKRDKRGYREILSRVGRKFLALQGLNRRDVQAVCMANGVRNEAAITSIWNEVERSQDLRRVRREIEKALNKEKPEA